MNEKEKQLKKKYNKHLLKWEVISFVSGVIAGAASGIWIYIVL